MKEILEWFKPGARVKRYIGLQLLSVGVLLFSVISLTRIMDLNRVTLVAYIFLITLSIFGIVYSFVFAQKNILYVSLKNISKKNKSIRIKKLLYADPRLKKGARVVVIGGGSGLPILLKGLKDYTSNITAIVNVSDDDASLTTAMDDIEKLTPGDIRKCLSALSTNEADMDKLLTYKENGETNQSVGNSIISALINITGSFTKAVQKLSEIFDMRGNIYPVSNDEIVLCAGLENGEVVVGKENIINRVRKMRSPIKQIFLKEGSITTTPEVIDAIRSAQVIVIGPGALYTSVISNLLLDDVAKAIIKSKAKKVYISNIMNQPGQTDGYTLARYINEVERYIGKHVLDYAIVNNGEITSEMIKDFNQEESTPVKIDLENIQNRAISVIREDLVLATKSGIIHDTKRLSEIIVKLAKSRRTGDLNIVKVKKKHMKKEKKLKSKKSTNRVSTKKNVVQSEAKKKKIEKRNKAKEEKIAAQTKATMEKIKKTMKKG